MAPDIYGDFGVKHVRTLREGVSDVHIVENERGRRVLKMGRELMGDDSHPVRGEIAALQRLQESPSVPRFLGYREWQGGRLRNVIYRLALRPEKRVAFLREYIEGDMLGWGACIEERCAQTRLETLVRDAHSEGISRLDLIPNNIILRTPRDPCLIDLGGVGLSKNLSPSIRSSYENRDWYLLEALCDPSKRNRRYHFFEAI